MRSMMLGGARTAASETTRAISAAVCLGCYQDPYSENDADTEWVSDQLSLK